ncbi:hypothetical protein [Streptomyces shenzhenensis]|uniref:hypothetical protein n=1 Tax=Streptomyces shenzhenensis TaxID=943815 RepID=UPI0015F0C976|nr:hypothetical protein [Streptomyces shenzhenensis]
MSPRIEPPTLLSLLGPPVRSGEERLIETVAKEWGVEFPPDFISVAGAYGDALICEYLFFCGARNLRSYAAGMGRKLEASRTVPHLVLPSPGGALVWGNTVEGDQLFLVHRGDGRWTVSAFRRGWADWYDTDLEFGEWFPRMLAGEIETDWMPEWPAPPYELEPVE